MSRKYKFRDQDKLYFVSFAVVNWIDLFIRNEYKDVLLKSFEHCIKTKGLELYAYCIMTSHVHLIMGSNKEPMENIFGFSPCLCAKVSADEGHGALAVFTVLLPTTIALV